MIEMSLLTDAFGQVLAHPEDRQVLTFLLASEGEVRYEALRKGVREDSSQLFKYCVDRLSRTALIKRRLVERGKRYESHLSLTRAGKEIAEALVSLSQKGSLPRSLPERDRLELQHAFILEVPATQ